MPGPTQAIREQCPVATPDNDGLMSKSQAAALAPLMCGTPLPVNDEQVVNLLVNIQGLLQNSLNTQQTSASTLVTTLNVQERILALLEMAAAHYGW